MFKKKTGVKIMAVILAAAIAMPSAGTALAAGRETVRQETGDAGGTWWDNLLHGLYAGSGSEGDGKNSSRSATSTSTETNSGSLKEYKVTLEVAVQEMTYGDDVKDKITVTPRPAGSTTEADLDNFGGKDYLLKYYEKVDEQYKELSETPKDAGEYFVRAYSLAESRYKSSGSKYVGFSIAKKEITIKPKDQMKDLSDGVFSGAWPAELAEGSKLAYGEALVDNFEVSCEVQKDGSPVTEPAAGVYDLVITGTPSLLLAGGAKADNYTVATEKGTLTIGKKLTLQVEENKKIPYGEFEGSKFAVTAKEQGVSLTEGRLTFRYFDENKAELTTENAPQKAGKYWIAASYAFGEDRYWGESEPTAFEITKRPIKVTVKDFSIDNGAILPDEKELKDKLTIEGLVVKADGKEGLPYEDTWKTEPTAVFENEQIDTKEAGGYQVLAKAELADDCKVNYGLALENGTMTVKAAAGEARKKLELTLEAVSVVYGEGSGKDASENIRSAVIEKIKATEKTADGEKDAALEKDKIVLSYLDAEKKALEQSPVDVGVYYVTAAYAGDEAYEACEPTNPAELKITERTITIEAESLQIANGLELPEAKLKPYDALSYEDKWAEGGEPKAEYKDKDKIDTKVGGEYDITVSAKVDESKEKNYKLDLKPGKLTVAALGEGGKSKDELTLKEDAVKEKIYDGKPFDLIKKDSIVSKFGYTGEYTYIWSKTDGADKTALESAPKDAGEYELVIKIPDSDSTWEGSTTPVAVKIDKRPITLEVVSKSGKFETYAGEPLACDVRIKEENAFAEGEAWIREPVVKAVEGDCNREDGSYWVQAADGDAGENYAVDNGNKVEIKLLGKKKTLITNVDVKIPKKGYLYTGEQICPTVTVKCGKSKLKLNADYVVEYSDNVNAGENTAAVTVRGIGEYAGYFTEKFSIGKKDMKGVTLSEIGAVKTESGWEENLKKTLVVMDGAYEVPSDDYEILVDAKKTKDFKPLSQVVCGPDEVLEKAQLKVKAVDKAGNNYTGESKKTAKLVLLGKDAGGEPITKLAFDKSCLKIPTKGYTYNGKAQKPKVRISGEKNFKVVYSNNVNAGEGEVRIVGVYNKKKKTGYYGVSAPVTFEIKQKDIKSVKVSAGTAIPKNGSRDDIKLTVKDGKRILTEGVDYKVTFGEEILDENGRIKPGIKAGAKVKVTIVALGGNYVKDSMNSKCSIKFGQLNLASKTANIKVSTTGSEKADVTVTYNGEKLIQGTDYEVSSMKENKDGTYKVTIQVPKANKATSLYKGKRTEKKVSVEKTPAAEQ